jgi:hypothetical protein
MNYVHKVERPNGSATKVTANAGGVYLTFIKGKDGRPREVSRYANAMVYSPGDLYVRGDTYRGVIRQVAAVLNERPKVASRQLGFVFQELASEDLGADTGRCPGCTKDSLDISNCFDSCPLELGLSKRRFSKEMPS